MNRAARDHVPNSSILGSQRSPVIPLPGFRRNSVRPKIRGGRKSEISHWCPNRCGMQAGGGLDPTGFPRYSVYAQFSTWLRLQAQHGIGLDDFCSAPDDDEGRRSEDYTVADVEIPRGGCCPMHCVLAVRCIARAANDKAAGPIGDLRGTIQTKNAPLDPIRPVGGGKNLVALVNFDEHSVPIPTCIEVVRCTG